MDSSEHLGSNSERGGTEGTLGTGSGMDSRELRVQQKAQKDSREREEQHKTLGGTAESMWTAVIIGTERSGRGQTVGGQGAGGTTGRGGQQGAGNSSIKRLGDNKELGSVVWHGVWGTAGSGRNSRELGDSREYWDSSKEHLGDSKELGCIWRFGARSGRYSINHLGGCEEYVDSREHRGIRKWEGKERWGTGIGRNRREHRGDSREQGFLVQRGAGGIAGKGDSIWRWGHGAGVTAGSMGTPVRSVLGTGKSYVAYGVLGHGVLGAVGSGMYSIKRWEAAISIWKYMSP